MSSGWWYPLSVCLASLCLGHRMGLSSFNLLYCQCPCPARLNLYLALFEIQRNWVSQLFWGRKIAKLGRKMKSSRGLLLCGSDSSLPWKSEGRSWSVTLAWQALWTAWEQTKLVHLKTDCSCFFKCPSKWLTWIRWLAKQNLSWGSVN